MKITFLGNFDVSYSTESHHKKTYEKLGHKVVALQEGKTFAEKVLEHASKSDLFVWTHTHAWHTPGMEEVLLKLKSKGIPSAGYHLDLWKGIRREADLNTDPYWNIEYFFTCDKLMIPDLQKRGVKAFYLPAGVLEDECYLAEPDRKKFPHDVIFVGSRNYHPEWPYRPQLIDWLKKTYGDRFGHYGGDGLGVVRGNELNILYASAKVVVGDTLCKGFDYPDYFSDRLFETTGRGGFMVFPNIPGLENLFNTDKTDKFPIELATYKFADWRDLEFKINFFLNPQHSGIKESMRWHAQERTKKDHTYTQRLSEMINVIFKNDK